MKKLLYKFFVILPAIFILSCSKKETDIDYTCLENIKLFQNYSKTFNDLNDCHLASAQNIGISPVKSREEVEDLKKTLELIESNELYMVDKLTHAIPKTLLDKIAVNFRDSPESKKGYPHKIIITGIL